MAETTAAKQGKETNMTVGNPLTLIIRFVIPLFIGNVFQQLYNMVDSVIVGRFVGADALGAVGSTGTIMFTLLGLGTGLAQGFAVLPAQRFGADDIPGMKRAVANSILLSAVLSVITTVIGVVCMHPLLHLMNTPAEIYDYAYSYIIWIAYGTVTIIFYNLFSSLLRAVGNSRAPLFFLVFSAVLNIFLDLLLIAVFGLGTAGAAIATDISQGISAVLSFVYIWRKFPKLRPERGDWRFFRDESHKQMAVGLPMGLQFAITGSGTVVMQSAINLFGPVAISSFTAASKLTGLITQGFPSLGMALATYSAQNYGKGEYGRIRQGVRQSIVIEVVYALAAFGITMVCLKPMLRLFFGAGTDLTPMLPYAKTYAILSGIFYIPLGLIFIFRNAMQGLGLGLLPMLGGIVEFFARISCAVIAIRLHSYPVAAFCDPAAWLSAGIFTMVCYIIVMRRFMREKGEMAVE